MGAPGGTSRQVSGDREAGPEPADCKGPAQQGVKKRLPGVGRMEAPEAGWAQPPLPGQVGQRQRAGGSAGKGQELRSAREWVKGPCAERGMAPPRALWQLGTCWPPAPQPARLPRSQG